MRHYYRRHRERGHLRQRMKWFALGLVVAVICFLGFAWFSPQSISWVVGKVGDYRVVGLADNSNDLTAVVVDDDGVVGLADSSNVPTTVVDYTAPISLEKMEQEIFFWINLKRVEEGVRELEWSESFYDKARQHSEYMADTHDFVHSDYNAENIAKIWDTSRVYNAAEDRWETGNVLIPLEIVVMWEESPLHRAFLLERSLKDGAVGVARGGGWIYATFMAW